MTYAVLGPSGTFSEEAASFYWKQDMPLEVAGSIEELFAMLTTGKISDVLIPLENSQAGTIEPSIMSLQRYPVSIQGELYMPIRQHLMGVEKYELNEIELLVSQPAVYAQCNEYINKYLLGVRTEITSSTAKGVQIVKSENRKAAAIGNEKAAHLYGLYIIQKDIQNSNNITRFIHVSNLKPRVGEADKASMIFSLADYPGSLGKALQVFTDHSLNLTKIESRPDASNANNYSFYIDIDIKGKDNLLSDVISQLQTHCESVKYLGAYQTITRS